MKLVFCVGLPASGKSTFSKSLVELEGFTRINKDSLRMMIFNRPTCTWKQEKQILRIRDKIIEDALSRELDVVVDDCNFAPKHRVRFEQLAKQYGAELICQDFTDIPLDLCIERDSYRESPVGEKVITDMWNRYVATK